MPQSRGGSDPQMEAAMEMARPLYDARGWIKLIGIINIIQGVIAAISIVGLITFWIPLWIGLLLTKASSLLEEGFQRQSPRLIYEANQKLATVATIAGVLIAIALAIVALALIAALLLFLTMGRQLP
jgi:hypothetical protein